VLASTFAQPEPAKPLRFDYSAAAIPPGLRWNNAWPPWKAAARALHSPADARLPPRCCTPCVPGIHVVSGDDVYGGTFRIFDKVMGPLGVAASFVDLRQPERLQAALTPRTRLVWLETPNESAASLGGSAGHCGCVQRARNHAGR